MDKGKTKITRISPELAKEYICTSSDHSESPARYYTITPSTNPLYPSKEGWEDVTYYTGRKKHHKIPKNNIDCQWVYILSNPLDPTVVKIGFTKDKPLKRLKQINAGTGVYEDLVLEWAFPCFNAHDVEKQVHKYLQDGGLRVKNNKEFFYITVDQAKAVIERIGHSYKMDVR